MGYGVRLAQLTTCSTDVHIPCVQIILYRLYGLKISLKFDSIATNPHIHHMLAILIFMAFNLLVFIL